MAPPTDRPTNSMLFCRGQLARLAQEVACGARRARSEALHRRSAEVLSWFASHPLPDAAFVRLVQQKAAQGTEAEVRCVCASLDVDWQQPDLRARCIVAGQEVTGLAELPPWRPAEPVESSAS